MTTIPTGLVIKGDVTTIQTETDPIEVIGTLTEVQKAVQGVAKDGNQNLIEVVETKRTGPTTPLEMETGDTVIGTKAGIETEGTDEETRIEPETEVTDDETTGTSLRLHGGLLLHLDVHTLSQEGPRGRHGRRRSLLSPKTKQSRTSHLLGCLRRRRRQ